MPTQLPSPASRGEDRTERHQARDLAEGPEGLVHFHVGDDHRLAGLRSAAADRAAVQRDACEGPQEGGAQPGLPHDHELLLAVHQLDVAALRAEQRHHVRQRHLQALVQVVRGLEALEHGLDEHGGRF